jgi:hypothetical protein
MKHRNRVMQEREGTFTLAIQGGEVTVHGEHGHLRRATDIADLIKRFSGSIKGDANLTFIIDDQPAVMMSWERQNRMHELAHLGERTLPSSLSACGTELTVAQSSALQSTLTTTA